MEKFAILILFFAYSGTIFWIGWEKATQKFEKERAKIDELEEIYQLDYKDFI